MSLTLYYSPGSAALAPHIALEEAGAAYDTVRVDFGSDEQRSPAYLAINPLGRVPALKTDHGFLAETPAILAFIAQSFPEAELAPLDDPYLFARAQAFNAYLSSTVHVAHAHRARGNRWTDDPAALEALRRKVPETVTAAFRLIEDHHLEGPWLMGERYSICDPYLFTLAQWLETDGVDAGAVLPRVADHRERMRARPAVERAMAMEGI
jgi:glutathione S-transferase